MYMHAIIKKLLKNKNLHFTNIYNNIRDIYTCEIHFTKRLRSCSITTGEIMQIEL